MALPSEPLLISEASPQNPGELPFFPLSRSVYKTPALHLVRGVDWLKGHSLMNNSNNTNEHLLNALQCVKHFTCMIF